MPKSRPLGAGIPKGGRALRPDLVPADGEIARELGAGDPQRLGEAGRTHACLVLADLGFLA